MGPTASDAVDRKTMISLDNRVSSKLVAYHSRSKGKMFAYFLFPQVEWL